MKKLDFRSVDSKTRNIIRKRAIHALSKGVKKKEVALLYGVNPNTVTNWVKKHKVQGSKGLLDSRTLATHFLITK